MSNPDLLVARMAKENKQAENENHKSLLLTASTLFGVFWIKKIGQKKKMIGWFMLLMLLGFTGVKSEQL